MARVISKNDQVDEVIMKGFLGPSVVNAGVSTICQNVPSQLPSVAAAARRRRAQILGSSISSCCLSATEMTFSENSQNVLLCTNSKCCLK